MAFKLTILLTMALALTGCMSLPAGVQVLVTDQPEALCVERVNCYHAPSRTIVLLPGQSLRVLAHEGCHAHQHATVLDELGREPRTDMADWLTTREAAAYEAVVEAAGPNPWGQHYVPLVEDFAEACGRFLTDLPLDQQRAGFFDSRDFK